MARKGFAKGEGDTPALRPSDPEKVHLSAVLYVLIAAFCLDVLKGTRCVTPKGGGKNQGPSTREPCRPP